MASEEEAVAALKQSISAEQVVADVARKHGTNGDDRASVH